MTFFLICTFILVALSSLLNIINSLFVLIPRLTVKKKLKETADSLNMPPELQSLFGFDIEK